MVRLLCFCLLLAAAPAFGQDGVIPTLDSRSRLLGGTGVAAGGINSLWTNPAGYGSLQKGDVGAGAGAEQRWGLAELRYLNAGAVYGTGLGGFGVQLATFGLDTYRENRFGLGYGRQLTERFRVGVDFHGFTTSTEQYASSFNASIGLGLQLDVIDQLSMGARIFSPVRSERLEGEYLPQNLAIGFSYTPAKQLLINVEAQQSSEFSMRFRFGLEYLPVETIALQLGVVTAESELSFGLAYRVAQHFELNAGAAYHEVLGISPVFGVRYLPGASDR